MAPRLLAQIVARNEEHRFLIPVLHRLSTFVDDIIFTDDCSDDNTVVIAEYFGCKITSTPEPMFVKNEGALRTLAWSHLSSHVEPNDWVLAIDADEMLYGLDYLPTLLDQSKYDVLAITFFHMWNETQFRTDKLWAPTVSSRLFRFKEGGEFMSRNLACGSEPTYVTELIRQGKMLWKTPLTMKHLGYVRDEDKEIKYKRYMELDGGEFHNKAHLESIMDSNVTLQDWTLDA